MEACKNPTIKTESCYRRSDLFLYAENIVQLVIIRCFFFLQTDSGASLFKGVDDTVVCWRWRL